MTSIGGWYLDLGVALFHHHNLTSSTPFSKSITLAYPWSSSTFQGFSYISWFSLYFTNLSSSGQYLNLFLTFLFVTLKVSYHIFLWFFVCCGCWLGKDNERLSASETISLLWYSFSLSELVSLELVTANFCLGGSIIPSVLVSLLLSEILLDAVGVSEDCWCWFDTSDERQQGWQGTYVLTCFTRTYCPSFPKTLAGLLHLLWRFVCNTQSHSNKYVAIWSAYVVPQCSSNLFRIFINYKCFLDDVEMIADDLAVLLGFYCECTGQWWILANW